MRRLRCLGGLALVTVLSFAYGFHTQVSAENQCGESGFQICYSVPGGCDQGVGCQQVTCDYSTCPGVLEHSAWRCWYCDD
jgi:hypothetical protein